MSISSAPPQTEHRVGVLDRAVLTLYLTSLALLPWAWFPPFPWLHEHAQWSDPVFAATTACWAVARWRAGRWPHFGATNLAIAGYLAAASLSLLFSSPHEPASGWKLLGIAELCCLAIVTADLASDPRVLRVIARVMMVTALLVAAAAVSGLILFYLGKETRLIGIYGELTPSPFYARVQAGLYNPNLLASFCIFAGASIGHRDAELPVWLRRIGLAALWVTVGLTFSRGIIGFAVAALIRQAHTRGRRTLAGLGAFAGVALMIILTFCKFSLDPTRPFEAHISRSTSTSRYQSLITSLQSVVTYPLFGTGPGTHPARYLGIPFDSHMTYIGIAATLGLPALAFFSWLVCKAWLGRRRPTELSLWGVMAGLALDGLGQDIESFRHVWVLIGLVLADAARSQNPRSGSTRSARTIKAGSSETAISPPDRL